MIKALFDPTMAPPLLQEESSSTDGTEAPMADVRFEDIFALEEIQSIQDAFAAASGVASIITDPDGHPLTRPSHFTDLCIHIRASPKGAANCRRSDAYLGHQNRHAPTLCPCLSGGLLDGATSIYAGDRLIAIWLIGQVLDESSDPETLMRYAQVIAADEGAFREALSRVPRMSRDRFATICQALHSFARHLSAWALRNCQQKRLIDSLRDTQSSLKTRDRDLAAIIEFLPDPTLVLNREGAVVFWNRAMEKLTGVAAAAMLGRTDFTYGIPLYGTPQPILADFARGVVTPPDSRYTLLSQENDAFIAEATLTLLPGSPRRVWAKAVALRDEAGRITGAIESIRDITDRHQAEMALRESEEKFRRIVETANEGVWTVDVDERTTFVNKRMADMLGCPPEEILGLTPDAFMAEEDQDQYVAMKGRRQQGYSDIYEHRLTRRDGLRLWVLASASPLYDASGRYLGALGMLTDITERKRVEEELANQKQCLEAEVESRTWNLRQQTLELAEANIRLSELDRLKSVFLSRVSHELRTPLTSILGFAKLSSRDFTEHFLPLAKDDPRLIRQGQRIGKNLLVVHSEANRLTRLINDVLDLNRIESGDMQWCDRLIDPVAVARQTAENLAGILADRPEIAFVFDAPEGIPPLRVDPDQYRQLVSNLLNNAVKFTKHGEVRLEMRQENGQLLLAVRDTGIGIPADQMDVIFNNFYQVRQGDTVDDTAKGTGLGLAICRQIVRHYGGIIQATSEPGRGSVFTVRLPLADEEKEEGLRRPGA